jgi:hypothetical protein
VQFLYGVRLLTPFLLFAIVILTGCRSLPEKISVLTSDGEFDAALALLEDKGAGAIISPKIEAGSDDYKKAMEARTIYAGKVFEVYGSKAQTALTDGYSRGGLEQAKAAQVRCTWSVELSKIVAVAQERCDLLSKLTKQGELLGLADVEASRRYVIEAKPSLVYALDDESFRSVVRKQSVVVADFEAKRWLEMQTKADAKGAKAALAAIDQLDIPIRALAGVTSLVDDVSRLPTNVAGSVDWAAAVKDGATLLNRVNLLVNEEATRGFQSNIPIYIHFWYANSVTMALSQDREENLPRFIDALEDAVRREPSISSDCDKALAHAHFQRAGKIARLGSAAAAGLAHLARAHELDAALSVDDLRTAALATIAKLPPRKFTITISSGSGANPEVLGSLFYVSMLGLRLSSTEDVEWIPVSPGTVGADAVVHFEHAERDVPSVSNLSPVISKYFSHMQSVPNPQKAQLESRLAGQKIAMDIALSSYNSAVTSFNYNRTQWSLNAVNYAENNYQFQRNTYNSIVSLYNATSSTIQEPVYLPYSYFEGTMRLGYRVSGKFLIKDRQLSFLADKLDRHFVRINTRYTDTNSSARQDIHFPIIDTGGRMVSHLIEVGEEVSSSLASVPLLPADPFLQGLTESESACVAYLFHPYKQPSVANLGVPGWAQATINSLRITRPRPVPPTISVTKCNLLPLLKGELKDKVAVLRSLTCRIDCSSIFGESSGSGALISADGLILTAAHVVRGSTNLAVFNSGALKGEYKTEIVFIDDKADVALIRAIGLQSNLWFPVRFSRSAVAGESVVAIGYPAKVNDDTPGQDAVSSGIVSSVRADGGIVAALTVASGNSGGPLVDPTTGEIIGVVSQVISPGVDSGYASSGYWCKGVAATQLEKAVGLAEAP